MQARLPDLVIAGPRVFTGEAEESVDDQGVWVSDGRIRAVGPVDDVLAEANAAGTPRVVDASGSTVLPGLINMHVHFDLALPGGLEWVAKLGPAELALHMADQARQSLQAGVTTVRLTGSMGYVDFALRDAIENGRASGPRIRTAGYLICCTGGHAWRKGREADGPEDFARAVREQVKRGADLVKLSLSGGMAGEHEAVTTSQLRADELDAVLEVAHAWGRKVTAHAGPAGPIEDAVLRGLDCVEHGYELTGELADLLVERAVTYVPTIVVTRCKEFFDRNGVPAWMQERALGWGERHWESLRTAIDHGVDIAMGSDMPPHAEYDETSATVRELEFMVEAGMTPAAALRSATATPARWLGLAGEVGVVRAGACADLVVVDGDPAADVSALRNLHTVIKAGDVVRERRER